MITRTALSHGWTLDLAPGTDSSRVPAHIRDALPIPATVPGTVHTDLLAAGLIVDPYLDLNEITLDWIGRAEWVYSLPLRHSPAPGDRTVLAFDGLDTVASVTVNGTVVARTENMHRRYEMDVTEVLGGGDDILEVRFHSAWAFGEAERKRIGELPNIYPAPFNYLRKMACNFGWDWGPALVTAGIWRAVTLVSGPPSRIARVSPHVTVTGATGRALFEVELAAPAGTALRLDARIGHSHARADIEAGAVSALVEVSVPEPELWWPTGLGDQPLHEASVRLLEGDTLLDEWRERIGFRTVRLDTSADEIGSAFAFLINDAAVPVRGANWIPDDCFLPRVTEQRLRERLVQAVDANINLLRIWGGGVYESDTFYRLCDELGIMVWQDFLFACAAYPEDERLAAEVAAEARDNVQRLLPHPSLVLWNGNNENIWGWFDWDWQQQIGDRTWGLGYYLDLLPEIVATVDPNRPYWAGSPYSGTMDVHPNADEHGLKHIWDVWNELDYRHYRDSAPRFVSEFGWQGPAAYSTIARSIRDRTLTSRSPGTLHHQKANAGNHKLERGLVPHLDVPVDFDDWHFALQLNQAWAIGLGVRHFRSLHPRCFGTIVWQFNDCWPVTSWSAVDGDGRKKLLWYALRDANATALLTVQPRAEGLAVVAVNDRSDSWRIRLTVRRLSFDGRELARFTGRFAADRLATAEIRLPQDVATATDPRSELLVVESDTGERDIWFYAEPRDLDLPTARFDTTIERRGEVVELTVTAHTVLVDLSVFPDRLAPAAEADTSLVTLLPGESTVFRITGLPPHLDEPLVERPQLRTLNELLH
ncbi:glycoside hydrolase family 2 protein [Herbiconiux sp. CPCC 205763]|uniref:beta-mannosidase n=1 Tax=Herbiconiux aconitum TaxID=2970913 RepID=A0ABT2GVK2_9MICO|nr:glycoside hydrolase family 2 protein [Herbiconiux aconitum]MCS5720218.1 glycoside hydrolase family 2 protein [Herbiconiux aconitum]